MNSLCEVIWNIALSCLALMMLGVAAIVSYRHLRDDTPPLTEQEQDECEQRREGVHD